MQQNPVIILGGGIAGLSFAHFYPSSSILLEKEPFLGGLARSYELNGIAYDIGPHIIFSKHQDILEFHNRLIPVNKIKRSNQILFQGRLIKYPFENDLASLPDHQRDYCLHEFLHNPYHDYPANNMLQFFLKTFGEGITRLYLQPYNEKIWKWDPSFLDTQMVERIPKPPAEDIINSAQGTKTEGYQHQLYFSYPSTGGFQRLVNAYHELSQGKCTSYTGMHIEKIQKTNDSYRIDTNQGIFYSQYLINTMPLHEIFRYLDAPENIRSALNNLHYNSIYIAAAQFKKDRIGEHFALYIPDSDIIFHRVSKLNFLGKAYQLANNASTLLLEATYRPDSFLGQQSDLAIKQKMLKDLETLQLADQADLIDFQLHRIPYAYVIYDLAHRTNTDLILNYLKAQNIYCCGRFAEFEYMNSDQVVFSARQLANTFHDTITAKLVYE